jgi:hypothetical protein
VGRAGVGHQQFGVQVGSGIHQGFADEREDRRIGLRHLQCPLQPGLELVASGRAGPEGLPSAVLTFDPECLAGEQGGQAGGDDAPEDDAEEQVQPGRIGRRACLVGLDRHQLGHRLL